MAWQPDYASLSELKAYVNVTDTVDDVPLQLALTAASRAIDAHCGRQFGVLSSAAARYYQPGYNARACRYEATIDDLMSTTSLVVKTDTAGDGTYATTLVLDTDFKLGPTNAPADVRPWTNLVGLDGTSLGIRPDALQVTAKWGWTAVPDVVKQACLIQASRIFIRRTSPYGIAGSPADGSELRLLARVDPDVAVLLRGMSRPWAAV